MKIVPGDLLGQEVDVIVNAWNRNIVPWWLLFPQGVSGAIRRRAGIAPFRELARHGPMALGSAVETSAGRLPYKAIIHVAGIDMLWRASEAGIRLGTRNALKLAEDRGYASIAFPLLGTGTGGYSRAKSILLMADEIRNATYGGEVRVVQFPVCGQ